MARGEVVSLFVGSDPGGPMRPVDAARVEPGAGVEGDRYWQGEGSGVAPAKRTPDREITLIESEAVEALVRDEGVPFEPAESRRNVLTRGVALNHLVGREFLVGEVRLRGVRLCEPCKHLEKMTRPGVLQGLLHRGGLRAQVLSAGTIRVGDAVDAEAGS